MQKITVVVSFKAFFSFKNLSLASTETCGLAISFSWRRVSKQSTT